MPTKLLRNLHLPNKEKKAVREFSKRLRDKLGSRLVTVLLYGSKARGDYKADSDIDLFVLVKKDSLSTSRMITRITCQIDEEFDVDLTPLVWSLYEQGRNLEMGSPYFVSVYREGIVLLIFPSGMKRPCLVSK